MVHGIEVHLMADIEKYRQGMEDAKRIGSDSMGFISSIFDTIKRFASGLWDSIKSVFSGIGTSSKGAFDSMSDTASSAFQKMGALLPGFHAGLDKTKQKLGETEDKADGMATKIGVGVVAAIAAATAAISVFVAKGLQADTALANVSISGGLAASQISRFEATALRSNVSTKDFAGSMVKLREEMQKAAEGSGGKVFDQLGVKVVDANNALLKTDEVTIEVAKKIAAMSTEAEKYAAASKLGFEGKVQVLEDIARASDLSASTTDDQAAAVVRLGKIWHDILPGGKSMWAEISAFLTTSLTPAMTEASVSILEARNKIVGAFKDIFGTGSMFPALGEKIKYWSTQASQWFAGAADSAATATVKIMQFIAAKTGLGNANATLTPTAGAVPASVPLASESTKPVVTEETKKQQEAYEALSKAIKEKIDVQKMEIQTGATLTEGQRMLVKMNADLRDGTVKMTDAQKAQRTEELNALIAQEKTNAASVEARKSAASASEKETTAYASIISSIKSRTDAAQLELATGTAATDSEKENIKVEQQLTSGKLKLTEAHLANVRAALADQRAAEELLKTQKAAKIADDWMAESAQARNASNAALAAEYALYGQSADAREIAMVAVKAEADLEKFLVAQRKAGVPITEEQIEQLKAERDMRVSVEQATLAQSKALGYATQLADENKRFAAEAIFDETARAAAILKIDADTWQERIRLAGEGTAAQKALQDQYNTWYANQLIKPQLEAQRKLWADIDSTAHDAFISIFDSGKSAFDRLAASLKSGLMELLYQLTVKQWIINIGASVSATSGTGATNAASSALSALSSANTLSSAYNLASGSAALSVGNGISTVGSWLGSSTLSEFGAGFSGSASAEALAATLAGDTVPALSAAASAGSAVASAFSAAVPWIAAATVAYKAWTTFFEDGPEQNTRLQFTSNNTAGNISINERGNEGKSDAYIAGSGTSAFGTFGVNSTFWAPAESEVVQSFIQTVTKTDDALAAFLTTAEKASVTDYLTGKTSVANTGAEGNIANSSAELSKVFTERINMILEGVEPGLSALEAGFTGTSQELATEVAALLQYRSALKDSGEAVFGAQVTLQQIAALKTPTESTSAALTRITNEFAATNQVAQLLGKDSTTAFGAAGLASEAARAQIILLSGGLSAFTSQASSYAQNYLTDAERLAPVSKALDAALAGMSLTTIPATRDEFKALVGSLDLSSEGGQKTYAALMSVQEAFAQVHPAAEAAAAAVKSAADIASERADLQKRLDEATLTATQLLDQQRAALDASNRALFDQVIAAEAAKTANEAAAEAAQTLADANKSYQDQIDQLLAARLGESAVRALETAGMADSTIALYDRLAALKAEDAAATAAATAAANLATANKGYQDQIDQLLAAREGEAAVRLLEIAGMDASTVALYDRLAALKAEDAATAASIANEQKLRDAWAANAEAQEQAAAQAAEQLATARASKELELYNLTHTAAEQLAHQREMEIAAMDATLVPLQQQINAQQDLASAATAAAAEIEAAAQKAQAVAAEGASIQNAIWQLQGDTASIRAAELAALDPANRALKQAYYDLQDKQAADAQAAQVAQMMLQAQQQAAEESAKAAEALRTAWQSATDSIMDEVARIRGLAEDGTTQSLASAQSAFAIATAQARAGDQDAAGSLAGLSKTMLDLLNDQAVSQYDILLGRAQTATSLEQTAAILASQYGLTLGDSTSYAPATTGTALAGIDSTTSTSSISPSTVYVGSSSGGTSDIGELIAEVRALKQELRDEIVAAREANTRENTQLAKIAGETNDTLTNSANGYIPLNVVIPTVVKTQAVPA